MLTIDVERDWAGPGTRSIGIVLPRMVELLAERGVSATFFVVAELIDHVAPYLLGTAHEVGSHGLTHQRLRQLPEDGQRHEIVESKRRIEAAGFTVEGFRAPFLETTTHTARHVAEAGYRYDASAGRLWPGRPDSSPLAVGANRAGVPFTMTWLRMLGRGSLRWTPGHGVFLCHLHEFMGDADGWAVLPRPMRKLHSRNTGPPAWRMLGELLGDEQRTWSTVSAA